MGAGSGERTRHAVAEFWRQYEETILPAVAEDVTPATRGLIQLAFYFGARSMIDLVGMSLEQGGGDAALEATLDRLCDEVDGFLEPEEGGLN